MPRKRFRSTRADEALYTPVRSSDVPGGLTWKRGVGKPSELVVTEYSFGRAFKRIVDNRTHTTTYYKRLDATPARPAEQIDAEPERPKQIRFRVGSKCWFVDNTNHWFLCDVVERRTAHLMTIRPVTGRDADRVVDWPYGGDLEFGMNRGNLLYRRVRPLRDRTP